MKRDIYPRLLEWAASPEHKPLMLYGARQVGKTYILKELGRTAFDNMAYVNCYMNEAVRDIFSLDADVRRIVLGLSALTGINITSGRTLLFLDEVQDIPEVVSSLKYFCEDMPELHVAAAGSLLGVMGMEGHPFPTGKVEIMHLYPMTFPEFLSAVGEESKIAPLEGGDAASKTVVNSLMGKYVELLRQYYFVGGMPEAVVEFVGSRSPEKVRRIQRDIITAYESDIAKHAGADTVKARMVYRSIPGQLARENRKFVFGALRKGARAAEYETAIQWLVDAGLVYKTERVSKAAMPLGFYKEPSAFKLFLNDVGLLGALAEVPPAMMLVGDNVFTEFKGAFTENYVLTQIVPVPGTAVGYFSKENSTLEIDFVVQAGGSILPVEVKAEENVRAKSLRQFVTVDNAGSGMRGYRFSMKGFAEQDWMDNIPLPAVNPFIAAKSRL